MFSALTWADIQRAWRTNGRKRGDFLCSCCTYFIALFWPFLFLCRNPCRIAFTSNGTEVQFPKLLNTTFKHVPFWALFPVKFHVHSLVCKWWATTLRLPFVGKEIAMHVLISPYASDLIFQAVWTCEPECSSDLNKTLLRKQERTFVCLIVFLKVSIKQERTTLSHLSFPVLSSWLG
jgi:hypothetical protein